MRFFPRFRRPRPDPDPDEFESHLSMLTDRYLRQGLSRPEAELAARRQFGNMTQLKEQHREMRGLAMLDALIRDLRYGARQLRRAPAFAAMAVISLALGIGANTAIFQLIDAVRLRSLPVHEPQELAEVRKVDRKGVSGGVLGTAYPAVTNRIWEQIRDQQQAFSGIFAWFMETRNVASGGEVRELRLLYAAGAVFETLGVQPAAGRLFTASDDRRGCGTPGVVISHDLWRQQFLGRTDIAGQTLNLGNHKFEIIGATPPGFFGLEVGRSFDVALPICALPTVRGNNIPLDGNMWWFKVVGRLKPGWTIERAAAHIDAVSSLIFAAAQPASYPPALLKDFLASKLGVMPLGSGISPLRERYEQPLWVLWAISGVLLLIACANLASLLLARASAREREIAVRQSIGASRGQLVRQLLTESLLLAALGAAAGIAIAPVLSRMIIAYLSIMSNPVVLDLTINWRLLGVATGIGAATCVLFGLVPAIRATASPTSAIGSSGKAITANRERAFLRRSLVVAQVALSLVLVASAVLFSQSLRNLLTSTAGFHPADLLTAQVSYAGLQLPAERLPAFRDELLGRVRGIPGVESITVGTIPLEPSGNIQVWMDGADLAQARKVNHNGIGPDYLRTLQIELVAGRDFDQRDRLGAPNVAIVNEAFARSFHAGRNPIGARIRTGAWAGGAEEVREVVGLIRDSQYGTMREGAVPVFFTPRAQDRNAGAGEMLFVRSRLRHAETAESLKRLLAGIHPSITVKFQSFESIIEASILRERLMSTLAAFFGGLALLLAWVGLYGTLAYAVNCRRNEIGIRLALGASRSSVFRMIQTEGLLLVVAGLAIGLPIVVVASKAASALLFGLSPTSPLPLALASLLMVLAAVAGGYVPSCRAMRVDPMVTLRTD